MQNFLERRPHRPTNLLSAVLRRTPYLIPVLIGFVAGCSPTKGELSHVPTATPDLITQDEQQQMVDYLFTVASNLVFMDINCIDENVKDGYGGNGLVVDTVTIPSSGQKFQMILTAGHVTPGSTHKYEDEYIDCSQNGGYVAHLYNNLQINSDSRGVVYWHDHPEHDLGVIFLPYTDRYTGVGKASLTNSLCPTNSLLRGSDFYGNPHYIDLEGEWIDPSSLFYLEEIVDERTPDFRYAGVKFMEYSGTELSDGMSGSPVLDWRNQQICGIHTHLKLPEDTRIINHFFPGIVGVTQGGLREFLDEAENAFLSTYQ